jgi:hypothetical protein
MSRVLLLILMTNNQTIFDFYSGNDVPFAPRRGVGLNISADRCWEAQSLPNSDEGSSGRLVEALNWDVPEA